jgi:hypothetical protein
VLAGGAVALLVHPSHTVHAPSGEAPALARLADLAPAQSLGSASRLQPVIAEPGRAGLQVDRLDPFAGGVRPAKPARISIPAAGVNAVIDPVKGTRTGIQVPEVLRAGWFDAGPRPGEPGRAIIIGHLDSGTGPGLFSRVPSLPPGTPIAITDGRGEVHRYNVVGVTQVEKAHFPTASVYGPSRRPVLVLITCGGPYQPGFGYRDNILVYARAS